MSKAALAALSLCAFRVGMGRDDAAAAAPASLLVLPKGEHDARKRGKVICSELTLSCFAAAQAAIKRPRVALDFEHNTVPGTVAYNADKEPRAVAAWGDPVVTPLGIELRNLEWTPAGLEAWAGKSYQDLSPTVYRDKSGNVLAMHSVALCRHGELDGITLQAATSAATALSADFAELITLSTTLPNETSNTTMKPSPALIALLSALSVTLSESADETAVEAALLEGAKKIDEMKKLQPEGMSADDKATLLALSKDVQAIKAGAQESQRITLIAAAAAEGKLIPLSADMLKTVDVGVLAEIVKNAKPGQVPVTKTTPDGHQNNGQPDAFSAESLETLGRYGITEEDLKPAK